MPCAAAVRAAIEAGTLAGIAFAPASAADARRVLERMGLLALHVGLPAWMALRMLGG